MSNIIKEYNKEYNGIIYELFQEKDLEETANLLAEDFSRAEPLVTSQGITFEEFLYFARIYCEKAIKDGLSVIAKDNDKIVGFLISENLESDPPKGIEKINIKFNPIMILLNILDEYYIKKCKKKDDKIFHIFMGGVDQHHEKRHINTNLIEEALKLAKTKNFTVAISEATGLAAQHILRDKMNFNELKVIEYKRFTYGGQNIFKNIEGPFGCILMERRL